MVETMVTVVIVAFGLLGIAGLVSRSFVTEVEGTQRTQAMLLLQDMASRIEANRGNVAAYVTGNAAITGYTGTTLTVCDPASALATRDLCDWGRMLAGANEQIGARNAGVLVGARGCIHTIDNVRRIYVVSIAWEGMTDGPVPDPGPTVEALASPDPSPNDCGKNLVVPEPDDAERTRRRVMTLPVRLGTVGS